MRRLLALVFCLVVSGLAVGQDSRADLFGGYSFVNIDTNGLSSRQNANGWEAAISGNFNKWFAVEGDVSGYYKSFSANLVVGTTSCIYFGACSVTVKVTDYSYAGGPRINLRPVFIHALFGGDHLTGTATASGVSGNISESQDGIAGIVGGGVQLRVMGPWSFRASADYAFTRHNVFGGPSVTQNNFRAGVGIVYSFGAKKAPADLPRAAKANVPPPSRRATVASLKIGPLGIIATLGRSEGAEVSDEAPGSAAGIAGIHQGDVIDSVDGKPVRTPAELATELAGKVSGTRVRLGFLIRAQWQAEATAILQ